MAGNVPIGTPKHVPIWNFERGYKRVGRTRAGRIKAEMSNDTKQPSSVAITRVSKDICDKVAEGFAVTRHASVVAVPTNLFSASALLRRGPPLPKAIPSELPIARTLVLRPPIALTLGDKQGF